MITKDRHKNRPASNRINLEGQRFGKLLVISSAPTKRKRALWNCKCDCGTTVVVLGKYLRNGDTKSCGCFNKNNAHNRDFVGEIPKSFWTPIVNQANSRGIPLSVTREQVWELFLKQNRKCALTGVELHFAPNLRDERSKQTASLDRKDSSLSYTIDNVQWVHKKVNLIKNVLNENELLYWCKLVIENSGKQ